MRAHTKPTEIEYLPIRIRNQKKQIVQRSYWIANVLRVVDCADMKRSEFEMSEISKKLVWRFSRLVLDESRIPDDAPIFRLANQPKLVLVREDLFGDFLDADITGVMFVDLENFNAEFRFSTSAAACS